MIELMNTLNPLIHLSVELVRQSEDLQFGTRARPSMHLVVIPLRAVHYVDLTVLWQVDPSLLNLHSCSGFKKKWHDLRK
jgi:hypothetical protein